MYRAALLFIAIFSACGPAGAQAWSDEEPKTLLAPFDCAPIGNAKVKNLGFDLQAQSIRYGNNWLLPTATSSVDITVTSGLGGFYFLNEEEVKEFIEFSKEPKEPAPSNADTWCEYSADQWEQRN